MDDSKQDASLQSDQEQTTEETKVTVTQEDPADRLTPDHPRFKQVLNENRDLKERLDAVESRIQERQEKTGEQELTYEEQSALDRLDQAFRRRGYVTKDDLAVKRQASELEKLSDKYDGSNVRLAR